MLTKFWFSVSRSEQSTRFLIRQIDPVRQWKLSPMDLASLDKWDAYTEAKEDMFMHTDTVTAPWTVIKSNDKKRARLNAMRHVLAGIDYDGKDPEVVGKPDPLIVGRAADILEMIASRRPRSPRTFRARRRNVGRTLTRTFRARTAITRAASSDPTYIGCREGALADRAGHGGRARRHTCGDRRASGVHLQRLRGRPGPADAGLRGRAPGPATSRPWAPCRSRTATRSSTSPNCSGRTTGCGSGGAAPRTGGSIGSAAPGRPICSGRGSGRCAGSSSPSGRRSRRVSEIRLPDASDLLPPTLARALLQGVRDEELSRLPTRRLAGHRGARRTPGPGRCRRGRGPRRPVGRPADRAAAAGRAVRGGRPAPGADHHPAGPQPGDPRRRDHRVRRALRDRGGLRGIGRRRGRRQRVRPVRPAQLAGRPDVAIR